MRTRNMTMRGENGSLDSLSFEAMTPSLSASTSSSGSPTRAGENLTRTNRTISPTKLDTAVINSTPIFTPSPVVRRTLTYSPTKRSNALSQRITFVLLGCIFMSVLMTMLASILFLDDPKIKESWEHPCLRGGCQHNISVTVGNKKEVLTNNQTAGSSEILSAVDDTKNEHHVATANPQVNGQGIEDVPEDLPDRPPDHQQQHQIEQLKSGNMNETKVTDDRDDKKLPGRDDEKPPASKPDSDHQHVNSSGVDPKQEVNSTSTPGMYPRVIYYDVEDPPPIRTTKRELPDDPMLHAPPGFEAVPQDRMKPDYTQGDCVPMHDWQTKSFPNCNMVHEYDLKAAGPGIYKNNTNLVLEDTMLLLGQGWFRHTWRLNMRASDESAVLKTLRLEREFYDEFYDLHRRDAVAMERLTHSPFIMDIYGYCGQTAINELADFGKGLLASLEKVDRRMRGLDDPDTNMLKLQLGASVAVGVAHIHEIDDDDRPSMVHYDLNPRNIAIVSAGKPKINDFNIAEFLHWNPKTNETCGFPSRLHEPWWRAPEEVSLTPSNDTKLTAEVDVYALGSILFHVLTTHSPRGKMKKERAEEIREKVLRGEPPFLDKKYTESKDPSIVAFRKAMKLCFEPDPKKRGTSRQVADIMLKALLEQKKKRKARNAKKKGH